MATYQPLTPEQHQKAISAGFTADKIAKFEEVRKAQAEALPPQEPKKSFGRKVAEFIAPTTTGLVTGEKELTAKTAIGAGLEVGSFLIPAGGIAKGLGLAGKGAITLGQKIGLGSVTGALGAGAFETGRALGEEGLTASQIAERALGGLGTGLVFGAAIPAAITGVKLGTKGIRSLAKAPIKEKAIAFGRKTAEAVKTGTKAGVGLVEEGAQTIGRRIPEKISQFAEKRVAAKAKMIGRPEHVQEAFRKKIDDPIVEFVIRGNMTDKIERVEMLEVAKQGTQDISFAVRNWPAQVIGKKVMQGPVAHLIKVKDQGVAATKKLLTSLEGRKYNAKPIYDQIVKDIKHSGKSIPKSDVRFYQEVLDDLKPNKKGQVPLTYLDLHQFRQKWFDIAKTDQTFTKGPSGYAKHLRALLAEPINKASKGGYLEAQNKTREALGGLNELVKILGYRGKLEEITTRGLRASEVFMRALGNASDRPKHALFELYRIAQKYKYTGKEDILNQLAFADILEDIYGTTRTRSLRGQVGKGMLDVDPLSKALSAGREAAKWSVSSAALRLIRGALAESPDDVLRAFENLVRGEAGQKIVPSIGTQKKVLVGFFKNIKKSAVPLTKEVQEMAKKRSTPKAFTPKRK